MRSKGSRITAAAVLVSTSLAGLQASGPPEAEAAFPGENGLIVFESARSEKLGEHLNLIRLDKAGRMRGLIDLGHGYSAVPSPDGEKLAFLRHEGRQCFALYVMSTHGTGPREIDEGCDLEGMHGGLQMEWSRDGSKLAYTRTGPALSIADLDDGSIRTIPEAFAPSWSPDGRALVFSQESAPRGALFRLQLDANSEPVRLRLQGAGPKWSPDGTRIALLEYRDELEGKLIVSRPDGAGKRALSPRGVHTFVWSPTGRRIAFIRRASPTRAPSLYVVNRDGTGLRRLAASFPVAPLAWSPDGRFVAVATESARFHFVDVARGHRRRFGLGWPQHLATGPLGWVGSSALLLSTVVRTNDRELYVVRPDGSDVTALTSNAAADFDAVGSPDGRQVAFVSDRRGGGGALFLMDLEDRSVRRISRPGIAPRSPTWSPDGRSIAYVRNPQSGIHILNLRTQRTRVVARGEDPAWSPDGTQIAYASGEIYIVEVEGGKQRRLTNNPYLDRAPAWSPDGRRLAFVTRAEREGMLLLALINSDGSGLMRLPLSGRNPAWSPDGNEIVFDKFRSLVKARLDGSAPTSLTTFGNSRAPTRFEQNPDLLPRP